MTIRCVISNIFDYSIDQSMVALALLTRAATQDHSYFPNAVCALANIAVANVTDKAGKLRFTYFQLTHSSIRQTYRGRTTAIRYSALTI